MSQHLHLNLSKHKSNEDITKILSPDNHCVCCLAQKVPFIYLPTCKHTNFLEYITKNKMVFQDALICLICHHKLKKIEQFKRLVEESFGVMNEQLRHCFFGFKKGQELKLNKCNQSLQFSAINITDNTIDKEPNKEINIDLPLKKIKKNKNAKENEEVNAKENVIEKEFVKPNVHDKCEDIIVLSDEEIISESNKERLIEEYLNLPYRCELCITGFEDESILNDHMEETHTQRNGGILCVRCMSVLTTERKVNIEHENSNDIDLSLSQIKKKDNTIDKEGVKANAHDKNEDVIALSDEEMISESDKERLTEEYLNCPYRCELCITGFEDVSTLSEHMAKTHTQRNGGFLCERCTSELSTEETRRFKCANCKGKFETKCSLKQHMDDVHLKRYECPECHKVFKLRSALNRHIKTVHEKIRSPRDRYASFTVKGSH
ncbi:uncharacterized protein ACR2FA_010067 [Aphomia sociella]